MGRGRGREGVGGGTFETGAGCEERADRCRVASAPQRKDCVTTENRRRMPLHPWLLVTTVAAGHHGGSNFNIHTRAKPVEMPCLYCNTHATTKDICEREEDAPSVLRSGPPQKMMWVISSTLLHRQSKMRCSCCACMLFCTASHLKPP